MASTLHNPVLDQDRAEDLLDNWRKYGYVMFPQQRAIYDQIRWLVEDKTVLEAGCGNGIGTAVLSLEACVVIGTDKSERNIAFARELYPWIAFDVWDIGQPWRGKQAKAVVCVEALEHVADPQAALKNLIAAATEEVWISTPNGTGKPRPPENPHHVCEYTPEEMAGMLGALDRKTELRVLAWDDFRLLTLDTDVSPLVYHVRLQ